MNTSPNIANLNISPKFCRFCASSKPSGSLRDLSIHPDTLEDVERIIRLLGINFVQMSDDALPKAICDICYRNLKTCCQVFEIARNSQKVLSEIFSENEGSQEIDTLSELNSPSILEKEKEVAKILAGLSLSKSKRKENTETTPQSEHEAFEEKSQPVEIPEQPPKPSGVAQQHLEPAGVRQQHLQTAGVRQQHLQTAGVSEQLLTPAGVSQQPVKPGPTQLEYKADSHGRIRNPIWEKYPMKCEQCGVSNTSILDLLEHRKSAHRLFGFRCADCPIMVPTFLAFIEHVREHRPELIEYCPICHLKTDDRIHILSHPEALVDHTLSDSPKIDGVKRKMVDMRDRCQLFGGVKVRREISCWTDCPWICRYCKKEFQDQPGLRSHIMEHHS